MADSMSIDQVLGQIRAIRQQASTRVDAIQDAAPQTERVEFGNLLKASVESVNTTQKTASEMASALERGDANVTLPEVMVALQKADVSFTAMVEVRNKLIDAYQEVMRMSV